MVYVLRVKKNEHLPQYFNTKYDAQRMQRLFGGKIEEYERVR